MEVLLLGLRSLFTWTVEKNNRIIWCLQGPRLCLESVELGCCPASMPALSDKDLGYLLAGQGWPSFYHQSFQREGGDFRCTQKPTMNKPTAQLQWSLLPVPLPLNCALLLSWVIMPTNTLTAIQVGGWARASKTSIYTTDNNHQPIFWYVWQPASETMQLVTIELWRIHRFESY